MDEGLLTCRVLAGWTAMPALHLAAWTEWAIIVAPPIALAAMVAWALQRSARDDPTARIPDSWCARCDTALDADHVGRYFSTKGGYLCPPELRQTGTRRHQPAAATTQDRHEP